MLTQGDIAAPSFEQISQLNKPQIHLSARCPYRSLLLRPVPFTVSQKI